MAISVGSVSVDVVPSARHFSRDLQAQLADQDVAVRAKLDDKGVKAELEDLQRDRSTKLDVVVDDRKAKAKLDDLTRTRTAKIKVDDGGTADRTKGKLHGLLSSLVLLAPSVAPFTAAAVAGGAAVAGLGVAGVLAFEGIKNEMAKATPEGQAVSGVLVGLKGDLTSLEQTAAQGVLKGFLDAAATANSEVPELRREVADLSRSLGSDLQPVAAGVFGLFRDFAPVLDEVDGAIHRGAVNFEAWANGPGGVRFANYMATELPIVAHTLEEIFEAGGHVVTALLPLGNVVLHGITDLSTAIAHIPVGVIQDLFVAFAAYKVVQLATLATDAYTKAVARLGLTAGSTATKVAALDAAEAAGGGKGGVGGLGGILSLGRGVANKAAPAAAGSLGVLGGLGAAAAGGVVLGAAGANIITRHGQGIDNSAANKIAAGGQAGLASAQAQLKSYQTELASMTKTQQDAAKAGGSQLQIAEGQIPALERLQTKTRDLAVAVGLAKTEMVKNGQATTQAAFAQQAAAVATALLNSNADTLIKTLDTESAKVLGIRDANIAWHQSLADADAALKANGRTLDLTTAKGRANATVLDEVAAAAVRHADAARADGKVGDALNTVIDKERAQLIKVAEKFGDSATQAKRFADAVLGIPAKVTVKYNEVGLAAALKGARNLDQALRDAAQFGAAAVRDTHGQFGAAFAGGAAGDYNAPGGFKRVGEFGPEIAYIPPRGEIVPHHVLAAAFATASQQPNAAVAGRGGSQSMPQVVLTGNTFGMTPESVAAAISIKQQDVAVIYGLASGG